jgi:hypothetical protein
MGKMMFNHCSLTSLTVFLRVWIGLSQLDTWKRDGLTLLLAIWICVGCWRGFGANDMKFDWTTTKREDVVTKQRLRIHGHQHAGDEVEE